MLLWQDVLVGVLFLGYGISLRVRDVIVMRLIRQIIVVDRCGGTASAKQLLPGSESLGREDPACGTDADQENHDVLEHEGSEGW